MISAVKTDVGKVRANNEDAYYFPENDVNYPHLFIVADGMGGHQGGEIASQIAVNAVSSYVNDNITRKSDTNQVKKILELSLQNANRKIYDMSLENPELLGMGTTITMGLFHNKYLYVGHVGDSRAYRIRDNSIEQLTKDHSLVWRLAEEGRITIEETKTHPMKNVITRALGSDKVVEPDIMKFDLRDNDMIILCSDGLTNMLDDQNIKNIVCNLTPEQAAQKLVEEANLRGGEDNITVCIIKADKVGM